jgi:ATP-dependent DNA helicase RecG
LLKEKNSEGIRKDFGKKMSEKITALIKSDTTITIERLAKRTGVTTRAVERNLKKLQEMNKIKRVGPNKGGYWEVVG